MSAIKVFAKTGCCYSDMLKNLLKYHKIEFENVPVDNPEKLREMKRLSGQERTPVLQVDDKFFVGFDRIKIKEILNLK